VTRLAVGLGNPGPEYEWTRHNVGFHVLDHVVRHEGLLFHPGRSLEGFQGPKAFRWARSFDPDVLYVKPETWMNRSGDVVAPLVRFLQAGSESAEAPEGGETDGEQSSPEPALECLVVYDDLDLPLGHLRIRPHGGAGGHNGMRSIIDRLGSNRFPRLRVGIGSPGTDAVRHVLSRFAPKEQVEIEISVAEAAEAVLDWATDGDVERCMTRFHSRWNQGA
jgi:PTH1 family peptidyl-tRNA hydrolase